MKLRRLLILTGIIWLSACSDPKPLATVNYVDLQKFMGDWYVIANIPTAFEKNAHNPIESYRLNPDGTIATAFTFNDGSLQGEQKVFTATGFVLNKQTNAEWGMQFFWPIKADYRVIYVDQNYQYTVVGRNKRDYLWIMARRPDMPESVYNELRQMVVAMGYDEQLIQRANHHPLLPQS